MNTFFTALTIGFGFSCGIAIFIYLIYKWDMRNNKTEEVRIHNPHEGDFYVKGNIIADGNINARGYFTGMSGTAPLSEEEKIGY